MDYVWFLFRFERRINRAKYFLGGLTLMCWGLFLGALLLGVAAMFHADKSMSFGFDVDDIFRLVDPASLRLTIDSLRKEDLTSWATLLPLLFRVVVTPVMIWCSAAILIKRLHDRDKTAWWMVPFFAAPGLYRQFEDRLGDPTAAEILGLVTSVLFIWGFVEIIFLRGTRGPNRFGPDPLAPVDNRPGWDQQSELEFVPHAAGPLPEGHGKRGA